MSSCSNIRSAILIIKSLSQFIDIQITENSWSEFIDRFLSEDPYIQNLNNLYSKICQFGDLFNKPVNECLMILVNFLGCANNFDSNFVVNNNSTLPFYKSNLELYVNIANFSNHSGLLHCYWEGTWIDLSIPSSQYTIKEKPYNIYWKFSSYYPVDNYILEAHLSQSLSNWISQNPKRTLGKAGRINSISHKASNESSEKLEKEISDLRNQIQTKDQKIHELETENRNLVQQLQSKNQANPNASQIISSRNVINNPIELIAALNNASKHPLPNYGNTCYLNAIVQVLASMNIFILELWKAKDETLKLLRNLLIDMRLPTKRNEAGAEILQLKYDLSQAFPILNDNSQQDSKEVLEMIFSKFEEEFPNSSLFVSNSTQIFTCNDHEYCSIINDSQNFLLIPPHSYNNIEGYLQSLKNPITFNSHEWLKCDVCGTNSISMMKSVLISKPIYLILSFQSSDTAVRLSENLNFEENWYSLFGVVSYSVSGSSGHYTAYTKENYVWVHYNDEHIEIIDFQYGIPGVYLAFYVLSSLIY